MAGRLHYRRVMIENGASLSEWVSIEGFRLLSVMTRSDWTTAAIGFLARLELNDDSGTVYVRATEYSIAGVVAGSHIRVDSAVFE